MKNNMCSSVVMLSRSHLHPHPNNPRKDLGDLEELRESIREHGVMQNLMVIPVDDNFEDFTILIGHRRYAASEGILTELPCVIVEDLSDREQIGIMLCENLQRNDLTFIEQATILVKALFLEYYNEHTMEVTIAREDREEVCEGGNIQ